LYCVGVGPLQDVLLGSQPLKTHKCIFMADESRIQVAASCLRACIETNLACARAQERQLRPVSNHPPNADHVKSHFFTRIGVFVCVGDTEQGRRTLQGYCKHHVRAVRYA
jgi:hypothetical protein